MTDLTAISMRKRKEKHVRLQRQRDRNQGEEDSVGHRQAIQRTGAAKAA